MNNLFVGLLLLAVALYAHRPCRSRALVGAFICGLGLTNQHTLALYEVPVITWVLWDLHCRHLLNASCFLALAAVFFVGFLPYGYLVWASVHPTRGSWGDLTTVAGFLKHLLRSEYGTFQLSPMKATSLMSDRLRLYAHHVYESLPFAPASAAVLALGLADAVCDTTTVCSR